MVLKSISFLIFSWLVNYLVVIKHKLQHSIIVSSCFSYIYKSHRYMHKLDLVGKSPGERGPFYFFFFSWGGMAPSIRPKPKNSMLAVRLRTLILDFHSQLREHFIWRFLCKNAKCLLGHPNVWHEKTVYLPEWK